MAGFRSDPDLLVLHALKLKGFAEAVVVAELTGLDEAAASARLGEHRDAGRVLRRDGRISGWALTPTGREHHAALLADERAAAGCEAVVAAGYDRFLELNDGFKALCTAWQVEGRDPARVDELAELHGRAEPICVDLAAVLVRYEPYAPRLAGALERLRGGDLDAFTKPLSGSYHDVWMELHEDLMATLGRARSAADGH